MYDFIGDIHGHADQLTTLLDRLGYKLHGGVYQHPSRKVFFLGDLIDGGPKVLEVLNIVLPMVERGSARIVMGNHEFNFLSYNTPHKEKDGFLRSHSKNHTEQCIKTLEQVTGPDKEKLLNFIWQIPLWQEDESFQAIHACWEETALRTLKQHIENGLLTPGFLVASNERNSEAFNAVEVLLKGLEVQVPHELHFTDSYGKIRDNARVCWWNEERKIVIPPKSIDLDLVNLHKKKIVVPRVQVSKPTFFGHYWDRGIPKIVNPKAVCLDYSVAKGGSLCAYRFDGEQELVTERLVYV